MKHHSLHPLHRFRHRWPLAALLGSAALCACGQSSTPAAAGANTLHCAPASAKPDGTAEAAATSCAPLAERPS
jgi:hypothetical protein